VDSTTNSELGRWILTLQTAVTVGAILLASTGCNPYQRLAPDPSVSFAAHIVKGGLMIDETDGHDESALAISDRLIRLHGEATLVVHRGDSRGEGLWIEGPGRALVRQSEARDSPLVGRVDATWGPDRAIRVAIRPVDESVLYTGAFRRSADLGKPYELTRRIRRDDELYGTYRAVVRACDGSAVGWFEIKLEDEQPYSVIYQAALPPGVDEGLAAATAASLGEEISWINRNTLDSIPGMRDRG
jgi:hypothetical protein